MANYSSFYCSLILFLVLSGKVSGDCSYLSTIGGGCPDKNVCGETCKPCYRGIGKIEADCVEASGPIPFGECRCYFLNGAPCPPLGPPKCPRVWRPPISSFSVDNHTALNHTLPS